MYRFRFNHVFLFLMALSALCAFAVPRRFTDPGRGAAGAIFAPVSRPIHLAAGWVSDRVAPRETTDTAGPGGRARTRNELLAENAELRLRVANLTGQLEALQQRDAERQRVGRVRELCLPVAVMGADSGSRQMLNLQGTTQQGLRARQAVLYRGGLAGCIDRAGAGGAQARLITDKGFRLTGTFAKFRRNAAGTSEFVRVALSPQLVVGQGNGEMAIRDVPRREANGAALAVGDLVVLSDDAWPMSLQGYLLGRIARIAPRRDQPLFVEILVRPVENLLQLREVMVMVK